MKMYIVGTGTATVSKYVNTSCLFEEKGQLFLVDGTGGTDILKFFDQKHLSWKNLHYAFISHEHTDHFLGMIWVVRMIAELLELEEYEGDFHLFGHDLVLDKISAVCQMILKKRSLEYLDSRIHFVTVQDGEKKSIGDHMFTFFDIGSKKAKQYGFVMEYGDHQKLIFAGDEPLKEHAYPYCENADWLLSEAFCLYNEEPIYHAYQYSHQTVKEAAIIARKCNVKNLLIWHTEEGTYGRRKELYSQEAVEFYDGQIWVPDDGEEIII